MIYACSNNPSVYPETVVIDVKNITEYMVRGYVPIDEKEKFNTQIDDEVYYAEDVDASDAVDRDIAAYLESFTKEEVVDKLNPQMINAAISYLGDNNLFENAYKKTGMRLWQWITGKDARSKSSKWPAKCISHPRASRSFNRQIENYQCTNALQLAKIVLEYHWQHLGNVADGTLEPVALSSSDKPRGIMNKSGELFDITGAKIIEKRGNATLILFDGCKIWIASSLFVHRNGKLHVPFWLAKKHKMA